MSLETPRRGRPKGSGIDDQKFLKEIAAMIAAKPDLKPTTAIKALGITDPSAIRRLRDKFHPFAAGCAMAERTDAPSATVTARKSGSRAVAASSADTRADRRQETLTSAPAVSSGIVSRDEPVPVPVLGAEPDSPSTAISGSIPTAVDLLAMWYGMGISAMTTALATQAALTRNLARLPQIDIALRQQIAWNEMAMSLVAMRPAERTTLH